jgi:hypothetical protein
VIQVVPQLRILVAVEPVDFRKGIDSLACVCRLRFEIDPFLGTLFVFRNRAGTALKLLVYDGQGFWLCQNQPSSHYTSFDSRRGLWSSLREARCAAARSQSRSQRLQCFAGWVAGSS